MCCNLSTKDLSNLEHYKHSVVVINFEQKEWQFAPWIPHSKGDRAICDQNTFPNLSLQDESKLIRLQGYAGWQQQAQWREVKNNAELQVNFVKNFQKRLIELEKEYNEFIVLYNLVRGQRNKYTRIMEVCCTILPCFLCKLLKQCFFLLGYWHSKKLCEALKNKKPRQVHIKALWLCTSQQFADNRLLDRLVVQSKVKFLASHIHCPNSHLN